MGLLDRFSKTGPDLRAWAELKGLTYWGENVTLEGVALNTSGDIQSNICVGKLDGEEMGVVLHDFVDSHGSGSMSSPQRQYTRLAVNVPEALAPLQVLILTNGPRPGAIADDWQATPEFQTFDAAGLGLGTRSTAAGVAGLLGFAPRWQVITRTNIDTSMIAGLMQGALGEALEAYPGAFGLDYRYGTLNLVHDDAFLAPGPELDAAVDLVCLAARELRAAGLAMLEPQPFDADLPEPDWVTAPPSEPPKEKKWGPFKVVQAEGVSMKERLDPYARGASYEDALRYHAAFPSNPAPGVAWAVWRREDDGPRRRLAIHTEGSLTTGPCVVLMAVNDSAADHPGQITGELGTMSVAVKGGLMAAWMYRRQSDFSLLDAVETNAIQVAQQQGWL